MNIKDNRLKSSYDSRSIGEEANFLAFGGKEMDWPNDNGKDEHSQTEVLEDRFKDTGSVSIDSQGNEDPNEIKDESLQSSKKRESRHSSSVHITISDFFEADEDSYTYKNVMECEVPKLTPWYSETMKYVCVDEVVNVKEQILIESCEVGTLTEEASVEESFVGKRLPVQEFGTRSYLRSFIRSFEDQENKPFQQLDQGISRDEVSESPTSLSAESDSKGDSQPANIPYDSKIENGSITFDFKYPAPPGESRITNGRMGNIEEQLESDESRNFLDNTNVHADDISHTRSTSSVHCSTTMYNNKGDVHRQAPSIENVTSDYAQGRSYNDMRTEISHVESLNHKRGSSNDLSIQTVDPHVIKKDHENSDSVSIVAQLQYDEGESSFSASDLLTFSGPIAHSGNLSLRSDSSATSGRSFAFPILQNEWNSSPVRMAKGGRRYFRKHKGWRSGLLCCRF